MSNKERGSGASFFEEWGNAPKYRRVELGVESGGKSPAFHRTFRRTPDRLSLAGSSPGCPASVSPAEGKSEGAGRGSQEENLKSRLDRKRGPRETGAKNRNSPALRGTIRA